eukprot:CCRYP_015674-RA/>CCRYP_015674-RA protein AED:0.26 eAED:0.14 QI:0/0/0/1/0/0/3/0/311
MSDEYLKQLKCGPNFSNALFYKQKNLLAAHEHTTGGFISGEVKLAITLPMLAGGSYLDLTLLYEMDQSSTCIIFHQVVAEWINDERLVDINGIKYISAKERMTKVALGFAQITNGALCGCMGALDSWIVKIQRPWKKCDKCPNPSSHYSCKGYYGINIQAIVDSKKRILFQSIHEFESNVLLIDLRGGILWWQLKFSLKHNIAFIDACMRLHNFIIDFRESNMFTTSFDHLDKDVFDEDCRKFLQSNMDVCSVGVHGGDEDERRDERGNRFVSGRPLSAETEAREKGMAMRNAIWDEPVRTNFTRPPSNFY